MAEQIKIIEIKDWKGRLAPAFLILLALVFGWFSIRWQIGNMLAALTPVNAPNAKEISEFANGLSPRDPMTNWLKANIEKEEFTADGLAKSVESLEQMVRYAPYDYRYWIELGRGYEQSEKFELAEKALLRAVAIAPNYSYAHWQIGNFYLRQDRVTEALNEFRTAAETSSIYREQVFSIAWDYFEKDPKKLEELAGRKSEVRAGLAKFYAAKELAADSLRIWNTLTGEEKQAHLDVAKIVTQALYEKRYFRSAVAFVQQLAIEPQAQLETVQNGGFEAPISEDAQKVFYGWKITRLEKVDVKTDPLKKKEGNRSLRVSFNGFTGIEVKNVWQVIAVEAGRKYQLSYWLKTENLKSAGTPLIEIINANDDKIITTGAAFPSESNDWSQVKIDFTTPANAEGILIRLDRAYCGDACPIVGTFWLDDLRLEK